MDILPCSQPAELEQSWLHTSQGRSVSVFQFCFMAHIYLSGPQIQGSLWKSFHRSRTLIYFTLSPVSYCPTFGDATPIAYRSLLPAVFCFHSWAQCVKWKILFKPRISMTKQDAGIFKYFRHLALMRKRLTNFF